MGRLNILSNDEINALYAIPTLTNQEKQWSFELDNDDLILSIERKGELKRIELQSPNKFRYYNYEIN